MHRYNGLAGQARTDHVTNGAWDSEHSLEGITDSQGHLAKRLRRSISARQTRLVSEPKKQSVLRHWIVGLINENLSSMLKLTSSS